MSGADAAAVILVMAIVTFGTRIAGASLASRMVISDDFNRFLHLLSGCVVAALLCPALVLADRPLLAGTVVAAIIMYISRSMLWSIGAAVLVTALGRMLT